MSNKTTVEATHIEKEFVRVEFAHSCLVSDHGKGIGGLGKGPSPGDVWFAGLTSASVFCALDAAKREGVRLTSVVARAGMRADREGVSGPLHALGFLARIWRRLEIDGSLNGIDPTRLAGNVGILETLRHGVDLDERVTFSDMGARPFPVKWKNEAFLEHETSVDGLTPGERLTGSNAARWSVSATALDDETVLVDIPGVPICVSRTGGPRRGPTPHELLLGGLAGCTAIYVGRNAPFHDIPLERISVVARSDTPADLSRAVQSIEKLTTLVGELTDAERTKCKFFADFCALGETIKRGAEIIDDVITSETSGTTEARSPLASLARSSPPPSELACDDGSCCVFTPPTGNRTGAVMAQS